jgi:hypothetical protein
MADLGEAVLTLKVDGKEYTYSLGDAKEKAEGLDKVHQKSKGTLGELKLAYVAVAAAVGKVIKFAGEMLDAYLAQEKAEQRLGAAVKITGQQRTVNVDGLKKYAAQLQLTTNIEEEATMSAMGLLMQLGGLNERGVRQAIPLLQDFSVLMGMDLVQATELFAKSISSDTNALSRYGIQIKDGLDPSQKFAAILEQMQEKAGGFAEEMTKTTGGQFDAYKIQVGELKEAFGELLAKAAPLLDTLTSLAQFLATGELGKGWDDVKEDISNNKNEMIELMHRTDDLIKKIKALNQGEKIELWGEQMTKGAAEKYIPQFTETLEKLRRRVNYLSAEEAKAVKVTEESTTVFAKETVVVKELSEEEQHLADLEAKRSAASAMTTEKYLAEQEEIERSKKQSIKSSQDRIAATLLEFGILQDLSGKTMLATSDQIEIAAAAAAEANRKAAEDSVKAWIDAAGQMLGTIQSFASQIGSIFTQMNANRISEIDAEYAAEKARIETTITDEEKKTKALEKLEEEYAMKKYDAEVAAFNTNKAVQIANIIINTAAAFVKALPNYILAGVTAALGLAQIGVVAAQVPPPPPAFATGGSFEVPPGYPNDSFPMRVQSGEQVDVTPAGESRMQHLTFILDGKIFGDFITKGTDDKRILLNPGAIKPGARR